MPVEPDTHVYLEEATEEHHVLYLVVRESLGMSPGKIAAQSAHAVRLFTTRRHELRDAVNCAGHPPQEDVAKTEAAHRWQMSPYCKVVVKQADDKEWEKLKAELWCFVVKDMGFTEVARGSETVMALWPMKKSEVPKLVNRLQLLK